MICLNTATFAKSTLNIASIAATTALAFSPLNASAQANTAANTMYSDTPTPIKELGTVTVLGESASSLPMYIPTAFESVTGKQVAQTINATDSADALKYLPSLTVRKRYIGDYNHAVLASRASGTGNSARSLVYADGILLSNLLGNGASYTPRWGLVTPNEIERVDVLYGPFSAAYSGNSVGAVVDYQTRMPKQFEGSIKLGTFRQSNQQYHVNDHFGGHQASVSLGSKVGAFSWMMNAERLNSSSQPLSFATRLVSNSTVPTAAGVVVKGAVIGQSNPQNKPWILLGATGQTDTEQQHLKIKLAYDFSKKVHFDYTVGLWNNDASITAQSYLKNAIGNPVYSGNVIVAGRQYALNTSDFGYSKYKSQHWIHGVTLKSNNSNTFNWQLAASTYRYSIDESRGQSTQVLPAGQFAGAGRITDLGGSGWQTFNAKAAWRANTTHTIEFGLQQEQYQSRSQVLNTPNWVSGAAGTHISKNTGNTKLRSLWLQDNWKLSSVWHATLGTRFEQWQANNSLAANANNSIVLTERKENYVSPKAALAYQASPVWALKASLGRAVRMPTATELYQGSVTGNAIVNNDPNLKPEQSLTYELTAERNIDQGNGVLRMTAFGERTRDALYNQTNYAVTPNIINVQNVGAIHTTGVELAYQTVFFHDLNVSSSVTYADSVITSNPNNPNSVGKEQPRVPNWRANMLLTYPFNRQWSGSLGMRYSGKQYGQLDNSDTNSKAFFGFSNYYVADVRTQYVYNKYLTISAGIDNLNNAKYWAFHPYPQRTVHMDMKYTF